MGSVARSVISVTFSAGSMRRQVVTAEMRSRRELCGIVEREKVLCGFNHAGRS